METGAQGAAQVGTQGAAMETDAQGAAMETDAQGAAQVGTQGAAMETDAQGALCSHGDRRRLALRVQRLQPWRQTPRVQRQWRRLHPKSGSERSEATKIRQMVDAPQVLMQKRTEVSVFRLFAIVAVLVCWCWVTLGLTLFVVLMFSLMAFQCTRLYVHTTVMTPARARPRCDRL
jgi:hypothetical protein